jgi:large conductance mechanosensitive channel
VNADDLARRPSSARPLLLEQRKVAVAVWSDFKKFAFKGNVVDLAVGVVIGAAFGKIVAALVSDFIMPIVALVLPSGNWREAGLRLRQHPTDPTKDVVLKYGDFLGNVLDFLIVAFVLFLLISKIVKTAEKALKGDEGPATTKECPFCLEVVPVKASRCKSCTSELPKVPAEATSPAE